MTRDKKHQLRCIGHGYVRGGVAGQCSTQHLSEPFRSKGRATRRSKRASQSQVSLRKMAQRSFLPLDNNNRTLKIAKKRIISYLLAPDDTAHYTAYPCSYNQLPSIQLDLYAWEKKNILFAHSIRIIILYRTRISISSRAEESRSTCNAVPFLHP